MESESGNDHAYWSDHLPGKGKAMYTIIHTTSIHTITYNTSTIVPAVITSAVPVPVPVVLLKSTIQ